MIQDLTSLRGFTRRPGFATACAAGLPAALVLAFLWSSLIGGDVLSNGDVIFGQGPWTSEKPASLTRPSNPGIDDQTYVFNPDLLVTRRALAQGDPGLWNPYQGAGRPLLASLQQAPLFPPTWLSLILPFWHALAWVAALKLLLAAVGLYMLSRWCALAHGPAVLAGTAFAFSTYTISWLASPLSNSFVITPWVMLMGGRLARQGGRANAVGLSVAVAMLIFGGHPETVAFALAAAAVWCGWELRASAVDRTEPAPSVARVVGSVPRRLALIVGALLLGVGLTAVTLIPFAELLGLASTASRPTGPYGHNIAYSFAFPELWGNPSKAIGDFGPINYAERTAYLGALPMLLAVGGAAARRPRGTHLFWIVFTLFALLIALQTPLHTFVAGLPVADHTNLLRVLFLVVLGGSLLAGFGMQAWLVGDARTRRRMLIAMVATALLPVAVLLRNTSPVLHLGDALGQLPSLSQGLMTSAFIKQAVAWRWLLFGAAGLSMLALSRFVPRQLAALGALAVVAVDLMTVGRGYNPSVPLSHVDPPTPAAISYLQSHHGHQRVTGALSPQGVAMLADLAERWGLPDIQSYDFPKAARWAHLWDGLGQPPGDLSDWNNTAPRAHAALDVFAASYALLPPGALAPAWLKPVFRQGDEVVAWNPTALPRAWVAYSWRPATDSGGALSQTLASSTEQLLRQPVLERVAPPPVNATPAIAPAHFLMDQGEHVVLQVDTTRPGYLVLDDTYYPGWQATVDGRTTRIVAANEAFRAVGVPVGSHVVSFRYRPASATIGALVSLLSVVGLLVLGLAGPLRRRIRRAPRVR